MHIYWVLRGAGVGEDCGYRNLSGWHPCTLILPQTHLTSPKLLLLQHGSLWAQVWQGGSTADISQHLPPLHFFQSFKECIKKNPKKSTQRLFILFFAPFFLSLLKCCIW